MPRPLSSRLAAAFLIALIAAAPAAVPASAQEDDPRTAVPLPADVAAAFMAEMRTHMGNLDDIMAAIAEDDFKAAASIAETTMTMGHHRWQHMKEAGATDAEIAEAKARHKAMRAKGGRGRGMGPGVGMSIGTRMKMGMGPGFGRFMPDDFMAMGDTFHEAAEAFAATAAAVKAPAKPKDYRAVMEALQAVTSACRGCHDVFRVVPGEAARQTPR